MGFGNLRLVKKKGSLILDYDRLGRNRTIFSGQMEWSKPFPNLCGWLSTSLWPNLVAISYDWSSGDSTTLYSRLEATEPLMTIWD